MTLNTKKNLDKEKRNQSKINYISFENQSSNIVDIKSLVVKPKRRIIEESIAEDVRTQLLSKNRDKLSTKK